MIPGKGFANFKDLDSLRVSILRWWAARLDDDFGRQEVSIDILCAG